MFKQGSSEETAIFALGCDITFIIIPGTSTARDRSPCGRVLDINGFIGPIRKGGFKRDSFARCCYVYKLQSD